MRILETLLNLKRQRPRERKEKQDETDDFEEIFQAELRKRGDKVGEHDGPNEHI